MFTAYSLDGSTHHFTALKVNIMHQLTLLGVHFFGFMKSREWIFFF